MTSSTALASDTLIPLAGGFACRASVVVWLIEASFRLRFSADAAGRLAVGPRPAVTPTDDAFIRANRDELAAAVRYCDGRPPW